MLEAYQANSARFDWGLLPTRRCPLYIPEEPISKDHRLPFWEYLGVSSRGYLGGGGGGL